MNGITLWLELARRSFRSKSVYRVNVLVNLFYSFMKILISVSVWNALYAYHTDPVATRFEAITYSVISYTLLYGMLLWPGERIGEAVYSGEVGQQMVRPMHLLAQHTAMEFGEKLFLFFTSMLPSILIAKIFFSALMFPKSILDLSLFLLSTLLGNIIFSLINTVLGYTAFWLGNVWYMSWFLSAVMYVFGGDMIPLWFLPEKLYRLASVLPFRCVLYVPMEIYLGRFTGNEIILNLLVQIMWILIMVVLERFVWYRAQKRIVVQGG